MLLNLIELVFVNPRVFCNPADKMEQMMFMSFIIIVFNDQCRSNRN